MDDDQIRDRAYRIWEAEGRPEGRAAQHWAQARNELGGESRALSEGRGDTTLAEGGQADGRIIRAGEGGTTGGPDEADEALASTTTPEDQ